MVSHSPIVVHNIDRWSPPLFATCSMQISFQSVSALYRSIKRVDIGGGRMRKWAAKLLIRRKEWRGEGETPYPLFAVCNEGGDGKMEEIRRKGGCSWVWKTVGKISDICSSWKFTASRPVQTLWFLFIADRRQNTIPKKFGLVYWGVIVSHHNSYTWTAGLERLCRIPSPDVLQSRKNVYKIFQSWKENNLVNQTTVDAMVKIMSPDSSSCLYQVLN